MASFLKRVFTFGDKPADRPVEKPVEKPVEDQSPAAGSVAVEDLPVTPVDPVAPTEIETAGGPSADVTKDAEAATVLAGAEETSDLGVVPLSLLQAEAAAETDSAGSAETPPSALPGISPSGGRARMCRLRLHLVMARRTARNR